MRRLLALLALIPPLAFAQSDAPLSVYSAGGGGGGGVTAVQGTTPISCSGSPTATCSVTSADATHEGTVTTGTQTFAGGKTFNGVITLGAGLVLRSGGPTIDSSSGTIVDTGAVANSASVVVRKHLNLTTLNTASNQHLDEWYSDNGSTRVAYLDIFGAPTYSATVTGTQYVATNGGITNNQSTQSLVLTGSKQPTGGATSVKTDTNGWAYTNADYLFGATNNTALRFAIDGAGMPQLGIGNSESKPTCAAGIRGKIWHFFGGAGVKDTVETCAKDAGDAYAWRTIY